MKSTAKTIDEYLQLLPDWQRSKLELFRSVIHDAYPEIIEAMRWGVPTFAQNNVVLFAMASF